MTALGAGDALEAAAAAAAANAAPVLPPDDEIKGNSNYLRGTIAQGLEDDSTGALAPEDTKLTKFHGIYQQDDRDVREERRAQGLEPAYCKQKLYYYYLLLLV